MRKRAAAPTLFALLAMLPAAGAAAQHPGVESPNQDVGGYTPGTAPPVVELGGYLDVGFAEAQGDGTSFHPADRACRPTTRPTLSPRR